MPSKDSITKTIRINASDTAEIERLMGEKNLTWSGAIHYLIGQRGTPQKSEKTKRGTPQLTDDELLEMAKSRGLTGVHPKIEEGVHPSDNGVHPEYMSDHAREDIEKMCHLCGISTKLFFDEVDRLFNEGKLEVDCMKLKSNGEYNLNDLENACHLANRDVQEAIDNTVEQVMRGRG